MAIGENDLCEHGTIVSVCDICDKLPELQRAAEEKAKRDAEQAEKDSIETEKRVKERIKNVACFFKDSPESFKPRIKKLWVKNLLWFRNERLPDAIYKAREYIAQHFPEANAIVEVSVSTLVLTDVFGGGGGGGGMYGNSSMSINPVKSETTLFFELRGFPALVDEKYVSDPVLYGEE